MQLEHIESSYKATVIKILDAGWSAEHTKKELDRAARIKYDKILNIQFLRRKQVITSHLFL